MKKQRGEELTVLLSQRVKNEMWVVFSAIKPHNECSPPPLCVTRYFFASLIPADVLSLTVLLFKWVWFIFFLYGVSIMLHSLCGSSTAGQMAIKCSKDIREGKGDLFVSLTETPVVKWAVNMWEKKKRHCSAKTSGWTSVQCESLH